MMQVIFNKIRRERSLALLLLISVVSPLAAQRRDTVQVEDPIIRYKVFMTNSKGIAIGPVSYFDADSVLRSMVEFKNGKLHGTMTYFYPNGTKWAELPYKNGELHGIIRSYHSNGIVEAEKPFRNGKLHGERILKDSTGTLVNGIYIEELPYDSVLVYSTCVNGRPNGLVTITKRGQKVLQGSCSNGIPEGAFISYDASGQAIRKDLYEKGKFVRGES
jgi:antitoxin component YwqK of YwqJK toxin-antitoxin module